MNVLNKYFELSKKAEAMKEKQDERLKKIQDLAKLARTDPEEAKRQMKVIDSQPMAVDWGNIIDELIYLGGFENY